MRQTTISCSCGHGWTLFLDDEEALPKEVNAWCLGCGLPGAMSVASAERLDGDAPPVSCSWPVGLGVTMIDRGQRRPGRIVGFQQGGFTLRLDTPRSAIEGTWVRHALVGDDGRWRESYEKWLVLPGVRFDEPCRELPDAAHRSLADWEESVQRLEPFLLRSVWPAMIYMAMPSVLTSADELVAALQVAAETSPERERLVELSQRIRDLRARFRRAPTPQR